MGPVPRGVLMALLAGRAAAAGISWNINAGMKQCFLRGSYKTNPGFCHRRQCWHHLLTHSQIGDPASLESTAILQLMIAAHAQARNASPVKCGRGHRRRRRRRLPRPLRRRRIATPRQPCCRVRISRRREFCHFADTPCLSLLKHILKVEGGVIKVTVSPTARRDRRSGRSRRGCVPPARAPDLRSVTAPQCTASDGQCTASDGQCIQPHAASRGVSGGRHCTAHAIAPQGKTWSMPHSPAKAWRQPNKRGMPRYCWVITPVWREW